MVDWDERFRDGRYPQNPDPSGVLESYVEAFPDGPALDIATGTGRNAVFLATEGFEVDAIDQSRAGLEITLDNAADRGADDRITPIQADVSTFEFPSDRYSVVTLSFYRAIDRFSDIKASLVPGGYLFVEHHLRSSDPIQSGPSSDRYRFATNELLHSCLDLTVLYYDETREKRPDGRQRATARILARKTYGPRQSYPLRPDE